MPTKVFRSGLVVMSASWMTEERETAVKRPWRERLFTLPWYPWQSRETMTETVPSTKIYRANNMLLCHPSMYYVVVGEVERAERIAKAMLDAREEGEQ